MPGLGIAVLFFGYWIGYYGLTQVQGGNWGFLDVGVPGRWTPNVAGTPKDSGSSITAPSGPPAGPGFANPNAPGSVTNPATPANPGFQGPLPSASGPYNPTTPGGSSTDTTPFPVKQK